MKRLITDNTGPGGSLDTDKVLRAMLQYRNTPDPDTGLSPAQVIFGRQIRDFTPVLPGKYKPSDEWKKTMERREEALSKRHTRAHERLSEHTARLPPLKVGDNVKIQNQSGNHPRRWNKTGVCVEVKQHDQYVIKNDGSGRMTMRNRQFLRKFTPYNHLLRPRLTPRYSNIHLGNNTPVNDVVPQQRYTHGGNNTPVNDVVPRQRYTHGGDNTPVNDVVPQQRYTRGDSNTPGMNDVAPQRFENIHEGNNTRVNDTAPRAVPVETTPQRASPDMAQPLTPYRASPDMALPQTPLQSAKARPRGLNFGDPSNEVSDPTADVPDIPTSDSLGQRRSHRDRQPVDKYKAHPSTETWRCTGRRKK